MIQATCIKCQLANKNTQKGYEKSLEFNIANAPKGSINAWALDPFGTNMKWVLISLMFPSDQVDPVWIRSGTIRRSTYEGDSIWNYMYTVQI